MNWRRILWCYGDTIRHTMSFQAADLFVDCAYGTDHTEKEACDNILTKEDDWTCAKGKPCNKRKFCLQYDSNSNSLPFFKCDQNLFQPWKPDFCSTWETKQDCTKHSLCTRDAQDRYHRCQKDHDGTIRIIPEHEINHKICPILRKKLYVSVACGDVGGK